MIDKPRGGAPDSRPLTIGALSRATRIPVETLRTWERRYASPMPVRKPSGHRLYPAASVEQLRRVARLLAHGHRPGEVLGLSLTELDSLLSLSEPIRVRPTEDREPVLPGVESVGKSISGMLEAAVSLDRASLMQELSANWVRLGPLRFLQDCAGPFMVEIGRAWHEKTLEVRHEHFASACVSDFLREVREPYDHGARGPRVAAAMLPGDAHEGGLLMVCALLAVRGYRVVYLGADTPIEQIAAAARESGVEAVAISVSAGVSRAHAGKAVDRLRAALPPRLPLWVGGAGAPRSAKGVEHFETLEGLDARLAARP